MWKPDQPVLPASDSEPTQEGVSLAPSRFESPAQTAISSAEPATIGKGLVIRGEITGTDSLLIEGRVEGTISLEGNRVTVGRYGQAAANITAREVVVLGKVRGNIIASDRMDIRAEGGVVGDLSAPRISIEDGAFYKGAIDIRKNDAKDAAQIAATRGFPRAGKPGVS